MTYEWNACHSCLVNLIVSAIDAKGALQACEVW